MMLVAHVLALVDLALILGYMALLVVFAIQERADR